MCRTEKGDGVGSEIETTAICLGAALAREDTPEADVGLHLLAYALMDLHRGAMSPRE